MATEHRAISLSFVFPCLNEEKTLGGCIQELTSHLQNTGIDYEIVVADNGSQDCSAQIATDLGARVVSVPKRGYGEALKAGIQAARGEHVAFADADSTYVLADMASLYQRAVKTGADMAIASRLKGEIEPGAMPLLHRYLGTPVLTTLINLIFRGSLSDCNSGFRCLRKVSYAQWNIRAGGMEFASELLIKALKARALIVEVPSGLRKPRVERIAHLRTWRDGMRHLLFIFSECPRLFEKSGLLLLLGSSIVQLAAAILGPTKIGSFNIFDLHTQALLLLAGLTGMSIYLLGCYLSLHQNQKPLALTRYLVELDEASLFFSLLAVFGGNLLVFGYLVVYWIMHDFSDIHLIRSLLTYVHLLGISGQLAIGLLGIHIFKKSA